MNIKLLLILMTTFALCYPKIHFGQAPTLGTTADFVLFTSVGAVTNTGITHLTGNVGTNSGSSTGFGNVDGTMNDGDLVSAQGGTDLLFLYADLSTVIPTFFPAPLLGSGQILVPGVYSIPSPATMDLELILDGQNDPNSLFIIQIGGAFSTSANAKVTLINGALACNVFWKVEGLVDMASGTTMRGTIVANNAAINMGSGVELEGRALSINGAITVNNILGYKPIGCGSPMLTGPIAPNLVSAACYAIFSSDGPVTNVGITNVMGDVGTNLGLTTGYNPLFVNGDIHPIPDGSTVACASDLSNAYTYLNTLPYEIELLYPAQFGNSLVLTPHTYLMNGAVTFTDTLFLNAQNDPDAVFVIQINGALATSTYSNVVLLNGAQSRNVYWKVDGAVDINDYSTFRGTIVCNNGAMSLNTGVLLDGRALTTTGALNTSAVTVLIPSSCSPVTIIEPTDQIACEGDSTSFTIITDGVGLTYQWRKGNVDLVNGGAISGANSATLSIDPVALTDVASDYNVVIIGTYAPSDTSVNVSLTVNTAPVITLEPTNQIACVGSSISFTSAATGSGLSYQWRKGNVNLINGVSVSGATTNTLTINPITALDIATDYYLVVSGTCLPNDTSNNVSITVELAPTITVEPTDQTICAGDSTSFSVTAIGSGLSYQWRKGAVDIANGGSFSGATTNTLTINPATISDPATNYNVIVSGSCGSNDTSVFVALNVNTSPIIITEPVSQTACTGNSVSFDVTVVGTGLTYKWRKGNVDLVNGGSISGANSNTLTINPLILTDAAMDYNVVVLGTCTPNDTSNNAVLTINSSLSILNEPLSLTVCSGNAATFIVEAIGTGISYQWRNGNTNLSDGGSISGATNDTLTINPVVISDSSSNYNVVISGACIPNDTSVYVFLAVNIAPSITTEPIAVIACTGDSVNFSVIATGSGLNYQWRNGSTNLINGGSISGANSAILTIDPVLIADISANYNVIVSGVCAPNDTSVFVALDVNSTLSINTEPVNITTCEGNTVSFVVAAAGTGLTYQWRNGNTNLSDGGSISGATNDTLTINPVVISDSSSNYNVVISGACLPNDTSVYVFLAVNIAPSITTEPIAVIACTGDSVNFSVVATGSGLNYQWRNGSTNLINGGSISGANSAILTIDPVLIADISANYNVIVSGVCAPNDTSVFVALDVNSTLSINTEPVNITTCEGNTVSFVVAAAGTGLTYQWRKGTVDLINGGNISGVTNDTLTFTSVDLSDNASTYNVVIIGTCAPSDTSINVTLLVNPIPVAVAASNSPICTGSTIELTAEFVAGATYNWSGPNSYSSTDQNPIIDSSETTDAGNYSLTMTANGCISTTSVIAVVVNICNADLSITKSVDNNTPFMESDVVFTITATNNGAYDATGVAVTEVLQSGYTFVSSSVTTGSYDLSTGVWSIGAMSAGATEILQITATVNRTGNYVNTVIIYGNEIDTTMANNVASIEPIPSDFFIPEGFSPNEDGINDLFVIRGILHYPTNSFSIFNRWGEKVFDETSYMNTWDGKATEGLIIGIEELPVGTYFYILDLGNGTKVHKGSIYLNR